MYVFLFEHTQVLRAEYSAVFSSKEIKNRLLPVLQILMDDSEGHRLFSVKVDPGQNGFRLPDYNATIKKPMDLGTVEKDLLNGKLKTPDLFIEGKCNKNLK